MAQGFTSGINTSTFLTLTGTQTVSNKTLDNTNTITLKDTLFTLQDDGDTSKQVVFQLSGITTATTRTLTVPDASITIVGTTNTQTLQNKTLDNTNTVTLKDTLFTLQDDGDTSKQVVFQLSGITTATTRTLTVPDASITLVGTTNTQTLQNKTLDNTNTVTTKDTLFTLQDDGDTSKQARFQLSSITTATTRTYTLPDVTGDVVVLTATGIAVRTGSATFTSRSLTAPAAGITISNNDGVSGNPTFALANDLSAVEGLSTTGLATRTGTDTWTTRTITAGVGISVSNGDGVSGNPTVTELSTVFGLTDAATITTDASVANIFTVTLAGNRTLGAPSNPTNGMKRIWRFKQDATGGRTITLNATFHVATDIGTITLSTAANTIDYLGAIYNGDSSQWDVIAFIKGIS